jgi:hypothetical protein
MTNQTPYLYELFAHMNDEHGLTLTQSELQEIEAAVDRSRERANGHPDEKSPLTPAVGRATD